MTKGFDEIHNLHKPPYEKVEQYIDRLYACVVEGELIDEEKAVEELLDILIISYLEGLEKGQKQIGNEREPDTDKMFRSVFAKIADKTFEQRIREYVRTGDVEAIRKVADTETGRTYNEGVMDSAYGSEKNVYKTWRTMMDEKVRDDHLYLEGETVPFDEFFYSYDGDRAMYPGDFENPALNINCRCVIDLSAD